MIDLKEVQEELYKILIEYDRICTKHNLKYSIAWGTMLGAIRHGGFIPWDGDIDVLMLREDYEKFCKIAQDELGNEFFLQTKKTEPAYRYNVARIRKNGTAMIYEGWRKAGFHQGIYIDVQPLDHIPDGKIQRLIQKFFIVLNTPVRISANKTLYKENGKSFNKIIKAGLFFFSKIIPTRFAEKVEYHFITKYNNKPCKKIGVICEGGVLLHTTRDMTPFDASFFDNIDKIKFEDRYFECIKDTDKLLKIWYGDYMKLPPEEDRIIDHDLVVFDAHNSFEKYIED